MVLRGVFAGEDVFAAGVLVAFGFAGAAFSATDFAAFPVDGVLRALVLLVVLVGM